MCILIVCLKYLSTSVSEYFYWAYMCLLVICHAGTVYTNKHFCIIYIQTLQLVEKTHKDSIYYLIYFFLFFFPHWISHLQTVMYVTGPLVPSYGTYIIYSTEKPWNQLLFPLNNTHNNIYFKMFCVAYWNLHTKQEM